MRHFFVGAAGEPGSSLEHSPLAARVAHPPAGGRADGHGRGAGTVRWHRAARSASRAPGAASGPTPRRSRWATSSGGWPAVHRGRAQPSARRRVARGLQLARFRRQARGRGHRAERRATLRRMKGRGLAQHLPRRFASPIRTLAVAATRQMGRPASRCAKRQPSSWVAARAGPTPRRSRWARSSGGMAGGASGKGHGPLLNPSAFRS